MELSIGMIIKIILGVCVLVFVIYGVSVSMKGNLDFLPDYNETESDVSAPVSSGGVSVLMPDKRCEDCGGNYLDKNWCTQNECELISAKWREYSAERGLANVIHCQIEDSFWTGSWFGRITCKTKEN